MRSNGHGGPFAPFRQRPAMPSADGVPIVGQKISIADYRVTLVINCHGCGKPLLFTGKIGEGIGCQQCRVTAFLERFDSKGPLVSWGLRIGTLTQQAEEPAPEDAPLG